jgi:hypothetical protein
MDPKLFIGSVTQGLGSEYKTGCNMAKKKVGSGSITIWKVGSGSVTKSFGSTTLVIKIVFEFHFPAMDNKVRIRMLKFCDNVGLTTTYAVGEVDF